MWQDVRLAVDYENAHDFVSNLLGDAAAPKPSDPLCQPQPKRKSGAMDSSHDARLAAVLSATEIMILRYYQNGRLSQRRGQALMDMLKHPEFKSEDVQSGTIVHLIRRLERPFKETSVSTYDLWQEGDGDQRLEMVTRDYLEVFRETMSESRWKHDFDLVFRAMFDDLANRIIGPPCSALHWEHIQKILGPSVPVGCTQLYTDETFMGDNMGIESVYSASLNLNAKAKFQNSTVKLLALIPTYDREAASKRLTKEDLKRREMEVHQGCIGVLVRELNKYSRAEGKVQVLFPDGHVYLVNIIMLFMAMDHKATEQHCLKAANGCLSCDCPESEFADAERLAGTPMLVEGVIRKIRAASALYLKQDGSIISGKVGHVAAWEKEHKIKLRWNNWFDVSLLFSAKLSSVKFVER